MQVNYFLVTSYLKKNIKISIEDEKTFIFYHKTYYLILGILALAATQQYYLLCEVSARILPALCQLTMDPEKSVRDSAFRTIKGFLGKLEKVSEDPSLRESMGKKDIFIYIIHIFQMVDCYFISIESISL